MAHRFQLHFFRSVPVQEKINFARHLSIMIKAGVPLLESLKILRKQSVSRRLSPIVDVLIDRVSNGQMLAEGLREYRDVFGDFLVSVVAVGEASGTLTENLSYLSDELRKQKLLKSKVRSAMIYPIILLIMATGVSAFLTFFIFPKVLPLFNSLNVDLPATTRMLIAASAFLRVYFVWLIVGILLGGIAMRLLLKVEAIRYFFHRLYFIVPVVSHLVIGVNVANFTRVLAVLLKSGIKIVEAIEIASGTFTNVVYKRALRIAADDIKRGEPLARSLTSQKRIFPPFVSAMVEVGENTGNLENNLVYISDYYVEEVEIAVKNLTSLMEPVLLLFMGLLVGFIALSIITPIYSITQGLST